MRNDDREEMLCFFVFFLNLGFNPCKAEKPLQDTKLQAKEKAKDKKHIENLFIKNQRWSLSLDFRLEAI